MTRLSAIWSNLIRSEDAATMVEYGLMVSLIAAVCIGVVTSLGTSVNSKFNTVRTAISS